MSLRKTCLISFFFFFFFLIPSLIQLTNADPRVEIVYKECRKDHAQNMSQYLESYSKVVNDIQEQMQRNKFGFAAAGESPNRLYVLSQCLDDLSNEECATCFTDIRTVFPGCFPSTGGRVYLDGCFIRGENYSFYREALSPLDYKICSDVQDDSKSFNNLARSLISELIKRVPKNNNYADGHENSLNESVCAMANCLRTLDENSCSSCLKNAAKSALACLPSTEGRVLNAGCFLRYADYGFVNNPKIHAVQDAVFSFAVYVIVAIVVCLMAIAVGIFVGRIVYERLNRQQQSNLSALDIDSSLFKRSLNFNYSTLEKATEYFSEANKLGQGGYGEVFKGTLADGREIAVKRLFIRGENHTQDVYNEMDVISRAEHKNLVRLLGCSITSRASLLVYEFLVNKSLDCTLFGKLSKLK
ncbi:hypothetical protein HHK36_015605 [Tetracentron sinense]|uniref:Uncharacterized protein n=1 Tax=Tetracentron sinense TaxID=13715 RepID=A0A834Z2H3_TETSI|nr:hypothetical protein HHK36_015605 [Tetracentron sinense]